MDLRTALLFCGMVYVTGLAARLRLASIVLGGVRDRAAVCGRRPPSWRRLVAACARKPTIVAILLAPLDVFLLYALLGDSVDDVLEALLVNHLDPVIRSGALDDVIGRGVEESGPSPDPAREGGPIAAACMVAGELIPSVEYLRAIEAVSRRPIGEQLTDAALATFRRLHARGELPTEYVELLGDALSPKGGPTQ